MSQQDAQVNVEPTPAASAEVAALPRWGRRPIGEEFWYEFPLSGCVRCPRCAAEFTAMRPTDSRDYKSRFLYKVKDADGALDVLREQRARVKTYCFDGTLEFEEWVEA